MIIERRQVGDYRNLWKTAKQKVVFTNGCFDLLHVGHIRYLEAAHALGHVLVVGINSDASVRQLKGQSRPLVGQNERAEIINALKMVDCVVIFEETTANDLVSELQPDVYVKGGDYGVAGNNIKIPPEAAIVSSYGGQVNFISYETGHSTSDLIRRITSMT